MTATPPASAMPVMLEGGEGGSIRSRTRAAGDAAVVTAVLYVAFSASTRGFCPGGVTAGGEFTDADGMLTDVAPACLTLSLRPSVLVLLVIIAAYIIGRSQAHRAGIPVERARAILGGTLAVVILVPLAAGVFGHAWLATYPLAEWRPGVEVTVPLPLHIAVETSPLNSGTSP